MTSDDKLEQSERLAQFRSDLTRLSGVRAMRRHLLFSTSQILGESQDYELSEAIAEHFEIHPSSVYLVGSGKLGFSIAPDKRYRLFGDHSDLDLAIVDTHLFDRIWKEIFHATRKSILWRKKKQFMQTLYTGWIRPDLFPDVRTATTHGWWDFFAGLSRDLPAKAAAGIYRDWDFFESYQMKSIEQCIRHERGDLT